MKPSEIIHARIGQVLANNRCADDRAINTVRFIALLEFLDEHHVFRPAEDRTGDRGITDPREECGACDGSGHESIFDECTECDGRGMVAPEQPNESGDGDSLFMEIFHVSRPTEVHSARTGTSVVDTGVDLVFLGDACEVNARLRARHAEEVGRLKARIAELESALANQEPEEPSGMPEETFRLDLHNAESVDELPDPKRFFGYHCRITIRALYPIGPPAEVSKAEGRDA